MMARVPVLERAWGQDRLAVLHRLVGFTSFNLMVAHIGLITWGYAAGRLQDTPGTLWNLTWDYPGMLLGVAGSLCLVMVVVDQHPRGAQAAALRVVAPDPPLRLPRRRPRAAAPAVDRPGVPGARPPRRSSGGACGSPPPARSLMWRVGLPLARRCATTCASPPSCRRARTPSRSTSPDGASTGSRRAGRAVPLLALPRPPRLDPRPPLLALGGPRRAAPADHRQGARRRQPLAALAHARHARRGRGAVRPADRAAAHPAQGAPHRRRRRHHAAARARRGAGLRARRGDSCSTATPARRCSWASSRLAQASAGCGVFALPGPRRRPDSWLSAHAGAVSDRDALLGLGARPRRARRLRVRPARPGPTPYAAPPSGPACPRDSSTSRPSAW